MTYLYNTLHYYENRLRDKPSLKKRLVSATLGALRDIKPANWALSEQYQTYLQSTSDDMTLDVDYYAGLINRFVDGNIILLIMSRNNNNYYCVFVFIFLNRALF